MQKLKTQKITVPIDSIMANPYNPNKMPKSVYDKMKLTIQEKGLFGSIICLKYGDRYMILDGEHRTKACKELGYTELPVECSIEDMNENDIRFWTIYFNNTRGKDDIEKRSQILEALEQGQCQLLPFTEQEIENEKKLFKFDFSQYESKDPGIPADTLVHVLSFKFTDDEWKQVEQAMSFAKQENYNEKQWFMLVLGRYLELKQYKQDIPINSMMIK